MDRNTRLLAGLKPGHSRVLELGPSFAPVAPKRTGWLTTIVDHTDRDGLVAKYSVHSGLDIDAIEEVDHVWSAGPLAAVIPPREHGQYDALIASHVIEHLVDPITFLKSAERLLKPGGRIILAVPDLRLCFDCLRPVSTTGQVIAAWREKRVKHAWSAVFDAYAYDARPDGQRPSWSRGFAFTPRFIAALTDVGRDIDGYCDRGEDGYLDVHGWTFTPASFELLLLELQALGLAHWRVESLVECESVEFLAFLSRSTGGVPSETLLAERRMALLRRRCEEMRDLADWMLGDRRAAEIGAPSQAAREHTEDPRARVASFAAMVDGMATKLRRARAG